MLHWFLFEIWGNEVSLRAPALMGYNFYCEQKGSGFWGMFNGICVKGTPDDHLALAYGSQPPPTPTLLSQAFTVLPIRISLSIHDTGEMQSHALKPDKEVSATTLAGLLVTSGKEPPTRGVDIHRILSGDQECQKSGSALTLRTRYR